MQTTLPHSRELSAEARAAQRARIVAGVGRERRRRLVVGGALALALLAAAPTFALQRELVDFWSAPPAAARVQVEFEAIRQWSKQTADAARSRHGITPIGVAREVMTVTLDGERQSVWVVPTGEGGFCHALDEGMACPGPESRTQGPSLGPSGRMAEGNSALDWIVGPAFDERVHRVDAVFQDGSRRELPFVWVSAPIDAGIFAYDFPPEDERPGSLPVAVVGIDRDGDRVAHQCLPIPPEEVARSVGDVAELCARRG